MRIWLEMRPIWNAVSRSAMSTLAHVMWSRSSVRFASSDIRTPHRLTSSLERTRVFGFRLVFGIRSVRVIRRVAQFERSAD